MIKDCTHWESLGEYNYSSIPASRGETGSARFDSVRSGSVPYLTKPTPMMIKTKSTSRLQNKSILLSSSSSNERTSSQSKNNRIWQLIFKGRSSNLKVIIYLRFLTLSLRALSSWRWNWGTIFTLDLYFHEWTQFSVGTFMFNFFIKRHILEFPIKSTHLIFKRGVWKLFSVKLIFIIHYGSLKSFCKLR